MQLSGPLLLRRFVDDAIARRPLSGIVAVAVAYCLITLVQQAASVGEARLAADIALRATNRVRLDLMQQCLQLDLSFHDAHPPGALIQRIDQDPALLNEAFSRMAVTLLSNAFVVLGVIVLVFWVDWRVGLVLAACAAAAGAVRLGTSEPIARAWRRVREYAAEVYGAIEEVLGAADDLVTSGAQAYAQRRVQAGDRDLVRATLRAILTDGKGGLGTTLFELGTTTALAVAILLRQNGRLTIGDVFMVAAYGQLCLGPLQQLARQLQDLQPARAVGSRIDEVMSAAPSIRWAAEGRRLPGGPLAVEVRGVRFAYGDRDAALDGIDFHLPAGSVLGLLGRTASGKSTLGKLLVRLHDPDHGSVRIGGADLREVSRAELRRRVAYVAQDVQIVEGSLRDNLTLFAGRPGDGDGDGEMIRALQHLGLGPWFASTPAGLDTRLGQEFPMSAGEQQLVAIARVLLRHPGLVILDEPSSRLDPVTESRLRTAVRSLLGDCTAIVVAHRVETLDIATHLMVLAEGRIAEFGERSRLLADEGSLYAGLRRRAGLGVGG